MGSQIKIRCVIECPHGHPYDVLKQTIAQRNGRRCKACGEVYKYPDIKQAVPMTKSKLIEVSDCFNMTYSEIASELSITPGEAKKSCDDAMTKILKAVADDPVMSAEFRAYLNEDTPHQLTHF